MKCYCQQELLRSQENYGYDQDPNLAIWVCPEYHITVAILNDKIVYYTIIWEPDLNPKQSYKLLSAQDYPSTQLSVYGACGDYFSFGKYKEVLSLPYFIPLSIKNDIIQLDALFRLYKLRAFS